MSVRAPSVQAGTNSQIAPTNGTSPMNINQPGLLVVKHRRVGGFGKFVNVAVLRGDRLQLVDEAHGA